MPQNLTKMRKRLSVRDSRGKEGRAEGNRNRVVAIINANPVKREGSRIKILVKKGQEA